jgi:hypothetical protein
MKPKKSKHLCSGCYYDYYNQPGNSCSAECWHFGRAQVVKRKEVHIDQRPPWTQPAQWFLDCYHAERYIYVAPGVTQ